MPDSAITIDRLKALQIALQFAAKIAFDQHLVAGDRLNDLVDLLRRQILRAQVRIDVRLFENALRRARADAVNVGQRRFDAFVAGISTPNKSWHKSILLSLALFMPRIFADHADNILPLHDLARFTKSFN